MTVQILISTSTRIGWIGTGVMGSPMCGHLLTAGYRMTIHSRTRSKAEPLLDRGAQWAENPRAVAVESDVLFTMVGFPQDVRSVYFDEIGILTGARAGMTLIDMTTTQPSLSRDIAMAASAKGVSAIDAPVSGGDVGAKNATLSIMIGGDAQAIETVRPILEGMGNPERIIRIGDSGAGQICKACNQLVIGGTLAAVGEAFALARKSGVDPAKVRAALMGGFAASRVLEVHGQRILDGNFKPGFPARLYRKDLKIVLEALNEAHAPAPVTALVQQLLSALLAEG
ncbi:MAG: NAD(P)-dependent oxidoreductase, partial [Gammaproteobacteria bacterium]